MADDAEGGFIYRQCITLRNGVKICKPKGKAFKIPVNDNHKPSKPDNDESGNPGTKAS